MKSRTRKRALQYESTYVGTVKIRLCLVFFLWRRKVACQVLLCPFWLCLVFSRLNDVACTRLVSAHFFVTIVYKKMPRVCKYIQSFTRVQSVQTSIESGYVYQQYKMRKSLKTVPTSNFWVWAKCVVQDDFIPGWPDELVKKSTQNVALPILVKINT
jgi:hypothetical protein